MRKAGQTETRRNKQLILLTRKYIYKSVEQQRIFCEIITIFTNFKFADISRGRNLISVS